MEQQPMATSPAAPQKTRGGLLTVLLVLMLIGYGLGILLVLLGGSAMTALFGALGGSAAAGMSGALFFVLLIALILGLIVTIFVFKWKKWAVYVVLVLSALSVVMSQSGGFSLSGLIGQLIFPGLFAFAVWKKWALFE